MADRTVKVTLIAQATGYIAGIDQAARKTRELGSEAAKLAQKRQDFEVLGRAAIGVGLAVGAAVAVSVKKWAEFDRAMSQVKAVTQETTSNMALLRDAALEAGGRTVYTATEAANAIEELGKNGLTTAQILGGGLDAALDIAASGNLEVARAAEIAAITMKQFQLTGEQLPHLADLLAAGAGKAAGDVEDLAQAMNQSALVAKQTGFSVEETTGVLAAFADAGLMGSDAGTSFKTMLQRLTPVSGEAQRAMDALGISAYDTGTGAFIGAAKFAGVLQGALKDLTVEQRNAALAQIFGTDAVRAATVFYNLGADGIQKYIDQTNDAGYAARVAADRLDNLSGDVEKLGGSLDTVFIKSGSGANDVIRDLVQSATVLTDFIGDMPEPVLAVGLAFGVTTAAIALTGGTALRILPGLAQLRTSLTNAGISGRSAAVGLGLAGGAVFGATLLIGGLVGMAAEAEARTDEFKDSLDQATGALTAYSRELVVKKLAEGGAFVAAKEAGISQRELTDAVVEGGQALENVQQKLTNNNTIATFFTGVGIRAGNASDAIRGITGSLADAQRDWKDEASAQQEAAEAGDHNTEVLAQLAGQASATSDEISNLSDQILNFGKSTLDSRDANRRFQSAIDDAQEAAARYGATLDVTTDAGRQNQAALDEIAKSALKRASSILIETQSQEDATAAVQAGRDALIDQLADYKITGQAAEDYADRLGLIAANVAAIPPAASTEYTLTGYSSAYRQLMNLQAALRGITGQKGLHIATGPGGQGGLVVGSAQGNFFNHQSFASGGFASGIYAGRVGGIHKFAEPETKWEAYISGKPGDRARNVGIWEEAGTRLGAWDYGARGGGASPAPASVNLDGMRIWGQIDLGDGLVGMMDARIDARDRGDQLTTRMGRKKR